jgi:hypothetical protein
MISGVQMSKLNHLNRWSSASAWEDSEASTGFSSLFRSIPPERIGLNGEYDHGGLAKRVKKTLLSKFSAEQLQALSIAQRGRVVILTGKLPDRAHLEKIVETALSVSGAISVETHGIAVDPNQYCAS